MDRVGAVQLVMLQAAAATDPVLSIEEVKDLVDATQRWVAWQPATQYQHGTLVVPTLRNGHVYRALVTQQYPGLSALLEPTWPLAPGHNRELWPFPDQRVGYGVRVTDGTVLWQDAGPDGEQYNVQIATYNAWRRKAGKASVRFRNTISNMRNDAEQIFEHCQSMAQIYKPTILG